MWAAAFDIGCAGDDVKDPLQAKEAWVRHPPANLRLRKISGRATGLRWIFKMNEDEERSEAEAIECIVLGTLDIKMRILDPNRTAVSFCHSPRPQGRLQA